MAQSVITFYYGIGSRYSYLASTQIDRLRAETGREVVWRPLYSGDLFLARGRRPLPRPAALGSGRAGMAAAGCKSIEVRTLVVIEG